VIRSYLVAHSDYLFDKIQSFSGVAKRNIVTTIAEWHHCEIQIIAFNEFNDCNSQIIRVIAKGCRIEQVKILGFASAFVVFSNLIYYNVTVVSKQ
jgi:hypothetical protein